MASMLTAGERSRQRIRETVIESLLFVAAASSVAVTVAIVGVLVYESWNFFQHVPLWTFLTDTIWTPLFDNPRYGILPLLNGTLLSTFVALCVAGPLGLTAAIYLSEFASPRTREILKPVLELLAGVPTVVYGFFALLFVTPLLQNIIPGLPGFNILSARYRDGDHDHPLCRVTVEDAMRAVPQGMRDGSLALGATRFETAVTSRSAGRNFGRCFGLRAGNFSRGRRDHGGRNCGGSAAEPHLGPARARRDNHGIHRSGCIG